ncbi:alpha/beta hydrolase [Yinghuangia seranimata]|uniref:alpha/beta hydrolase n=1 Tax=Yinghuangia seranimata TaxID=408067 RepID=UPI00248BCC49|nr:alpha/beta hydrolase-fold protein [Yinghuangia seranimata]MDI2126230.1 alpha/beta hydrolase-fold protein [Yinghuangia seranimata]
MGLTSRSLIGVLGLLAIGLLVAVVWLWPKLAGRGWRPVLGRISALALTQVVLLALLGVVGNRYYLFYTSWDDLLGKTGKPKLHAGAGGDGPVKLINLKGTESVDVPNGGNPEAAGQIVGIDVIGRRSGLDTSGFVYLPPQYFQPQFKDRRFPVSVVLTGYPGDARNLITRLNLPKIAANEINAGRVQPTIYVMLRPSQTSGRDTECTDVPAGPQSGTFFSQDLPEAIRTNFRVAPGSKAWGMMGDSTGGYCSLKLAMLNSDRIGAGASLSGSYGAPKDGDTGDLYGGSKEFRNSQDLMWRLDNVAPPPVNLLLTTSLDEENYGDTQDFLKKVKAPTKADQLVLPTGGHNFKTWVALLPDVLRWMSAHQDVNAGV